MIRSDGDTLQGINISSDKGIFEDHFPFPQVGYVNFLEASRSDSDSDLCIFLFTYC